MLAWDLLGKGEVSCGLGDEREIVCVFLGGPRTHLDVSRCDGIGTFRDATVLVVETPTILVEVVAFESELNVLSRTAYSVIWIVN